MRAYSIVGIGIGIGIGIGVLSRGLRLSSVKGHATGFR
jgi:hypothetical protein